MPVAKIKISTDALEFEYEGDDAFIMDGLHRTIAELVKLDGLTSPRKTEVGNPSPSTQNRKSDTVSCDISLSMIMSHLALDGGQGLVLGAIAKLQIVDGLDRVGRAMILEEMQNATSYYDENARKNLSNNLARLAKKKSINQLSEGNYALTAKERDELSEKIAVIG